MVTETYKDGQPIYVAVDNVVFGFDSVAGRLKILLFQRQVEPLAGNYSLIGSFVQPGESTLQAAERILTKFTGLEEIYLQQYHTYAAPDRDPGARVISVAHYSLIRIDDHYDRILKTFGARWFDFDEMPTLVFDHKQMILDALVIVQNHARHQPIGFNLLPSKFTLPQLFQLYQAIYQRPLDDRNFRKKIIGTGILKKLNEKDKSTSKKGAFLYQFDEPRYFDLIQNGFDIKFY